MSRAPLYIVAVSLACASALEAQSLAQRVTRAPAGAVSFTFAAREGVCGNGRGFLMVGNGTYVGNWNGDFNRDQCEKGPVRVVVARADGEIVDIDTYVGPPPASEPGVTSLGRVSGADAAEFLLGVAQKNEGKPGRDAILPAAIADSATIAPQLLALARDQARPRETRRSAITWLAREVEQRNGGGVAPDRVVALLGDIAKDERDAQAVRQHALSTLARLERGDGIPPLLTLARSDKDPWLAKQAVQALARSGDPRSRQFLREAAKRTDLGDEVRSAVLRALGGEYATSSDAAYLRDLYKSLDGERAKETVLNAVAEMGGADNAKWLLAIARDEKELPRLRRRAVSLADRAGIPGERLVGLYDQAGDREMKEGLIGAYAQLGTRAATDKLLSIAKTETDYSLRRRAIQYLGRSEDAKVKDALKDMIDK